VKVIVFVPVLVNEWMRYPLRSTVVLPPVATGNEVGKLYVEPAPTHMDRVRPAVWSFAHDPRVSAGIVNATRDQALAGREGVEYTMDRGRRYGDAVVVDALLLYSWRTCAAVSTFLYMRMSS
jgi:hypothetical protein